jgi:hypothetical protein
LSVTGLFEALWLVLLLLLLLLDEPYPATYSPATPSAPSLTASRRVSVAFIYVLLTTGVPQLVGISAGSDGRFPCKFAG